LGQSKLLKNHVNSRKISAPKLKISILSYSLLICLKLGAQYQLPIYTDYLMDNYYLLHPAMAGAHYEGIKLRASHRSQWHSVENAPSLQTLNAHRRVGQKSGVGILFYNDKNGFHKRFAAQATYAHHINLFRDYSEINQVSFGLSVGILNSTHDQTSFDLSLGDPAATGLKIKEAAFYVDAGLSYNRLGFYAHLTAKNLFFKRSTPTNITSLDHPRIFLFNSGYFLEVERGFIIEPSFMLRNIMHNKTTGYDLSIKSHHNFNSFYGWIGVSYRSDINELSKNNARINAYQNLQQLSIMMGMRKEAFTISYAYTYGLEDIQLAGFTGHLFTLGIDIFQDTYRPITIRGIL
jgi:type IX secretion system PorP/SprF family membrane protein